jgi:hypothetical protein
MVSASEISRSEIHSSEFEHASDQILLSESNSLSV